MSASDYRHGKAEAHTWTGDPLYTTGEYHYSTSSQQSSACVVEPGTPEDVGKTVRSFRSEASLSLAPFADIYRPSDPQLRVIGATRTPFAVSNHKFSAISRQCYISDPHSPAFQVKSGGHTTNPGFSSTEGIQIYTGRFSQVTYDAASGTAVIGSGLIWDTVYERLQDNNVTVLGGRVTGVSSNRRDSLSLNSYS